MLSAGLTYKKTPVELREQTAISNQNLITVNQRVNQQKSVLENVILSTCNRTEIFAVVDQLHTGRYYLKHFLAEEFDLSMEQLEGYLEYREDAEAVAHCFEVSCGLDSMLVGETQILGQVKAGFFAAREAGTTGTILNYLFQEAIRFAKQAHTTYKINHYSASLSYSALRIAREKLGSLKDKKLFVLGAGEMSELLIKNSRNFEIGELRLFNRTLEKAERLCVEGAEEFSIRQLEAFYSEASQADAVISLLGMEEPFITKKLLEESLKSPEKPLLLIDLGVPRNISPEVQELPAVMLVDIDAVNVLIQNNQQQRRGIVEHIKEDIAEAVDDFFIWENQLGIIPIIRQLREQSLQAQEDAMESLLRKIPDLNEREVKLIRKHMKSIINQTLRRPIKEIKELAVEENAAQDIAVVQRVFGITTTERSAVEHEKQI